MTCFLGQSNPIAASPILLDVASEDCIFLRRPRPSFHGGLVAARRSPHPQAKPPATKRSCPQETTSSHKKKEAGRGADKLWGPEFSLKPFGDAKGRMAGLIQSFHMASLCIYREIKPQTASCSFPSILLHMLRGVESKPSQGFLWRFLDRLMMILLHE